MESCILFRTGCSFCFDSIHYHFNVYLKIADNKIKRYSRFVFLSYFFVFFCNYSGLSILIKGSASCNYSKDLQAEQDFFAIDREVIESKLEAIELPIGTHRYDFHYRLPRNIPYSVDGLYGNVKYFVQGMTPKLKANT